MNKEITHIIFFIVILTICCSSEIVETKMNENICNIVISGSDDKSIKIFDSKTGALIRTFTGHNGPVKSVALSPDCRTFLSGSDDHSVRWWHIASGRLIRRLIDHTEGVNSVKFALEGNYAFSSGNDSVCQIYK